MDDRIPTAAEIIDRVINIDIGCRGVIDILYTAAREKTCQPITLVAAQKLLSVLRPAEPVIIMTGAVLRYNIDPSIGETDGPPGAAAIARGIQEGFNALPILLVDSSHRHAMELTAEAAGLNIVGLEEAKKACEERYLRVATIFSDFPCEDEAAQSAAKQLIAATKPVAIIAVERVSMNEKGVYHNTKGKAVGQGRSRVDHLVVEGTKNNILTIGIGDGGNEIGMGVIKDTIREQLPYGKKCQCSCGAGMAAQTETDVLISATVSNWGAYGLVAVLSLLKQQNLLHDGAIEEEMLRSLAKSGFVDGITGRIGYAVDGLPLRVHASMLVILNEIINASITGGVAKYYGIEKSPK